MSEISVDAIISQLKQGQQHSSVAGSRRLHRNRKERLERRSQMVQIGQVVSKVLRQIEDDHLRAELRAPLLEQAQQLSRKGKRLSTSSLGKHLKQLQASKSAAA